MEELLPYYERELSYLRRYSEDFSQRYPKIAGRLMPQGERGDDPHVEQIVDAVALLDARIGKKLEDDYPQCIEAVFDVLYPHYLRPFPACTIAQFSVASGTREPYRRTLARGTELVSRAINGVQCRFKTAYDVTLVPLTISEARYRPTAAAPLALPVNAAGIVSITFRSTAPDEGLHKLDLRSVRMHLSGESSLVAVLADGLFIHALASYVEADGDGRWQGLRTVPIAQAGFGEDDALLDYPMTSHPAHRLLSEYFAFQEKFDFADVDLGAMFDVTGACQSVTLHVVMKEGYGNPHAARLLEPLSAAHFKLFATPVINLFRQRGEPVRVTHRAVAYPVVADASHASAYDIYSIDSVLRVRQTQAREEIVEFRRFFSQHFGDEQLVGHYWFARRDEAVASMSPGYETEISVIETDFDAAASQTDTLSLTLTCTNRDLPARLAIGLQGGDLFMQDSVDGRAAVSTAMLRRPTQPLRFERRDELALRLNSHLALDHFSLAKTRVGALRAVLVLYDLRRSAVSSRHIEGIVDVESHDAVLELPGNPFMTLVEGIEMRLTIDENHFIGASIATFVGAINTFLGYCVRLNSFVQLVVVSKRTGEEIVRCKPRSSDLVLA
jgi:type VI secretion system protein ImpG